MALIQRNKDSIYGLNDDLLNLKNSTIIVNNITERNAIVNKIDNMLVIVRNAEADNNAGIGMATYRWDNVNNMWLLISNYASSNMGTMDEFNSAFQL